MILGEKCRLETGYRSVPDRPQSWSNFGACSQAIQPISVAAVMPSKRQRSAKRMQFFRISLTNILSQKTSIFFT
jgi:hypothetical protein